MEEGYTEDGELVRIVQELADGTFLVAHQYERDDYSPSEGRPYVIERLWKSPPAARLDPAITELRETISILREEEAAIRKRMNDEQKRLSDLRKYGGFETLLKFLEGKITHILFWDSWGTFDILPLKEAVGKKEYGRYEEDVRMISLYGRLVQRTDTITFCLNDYRDGSGSNRKIEAFESLESAKARMQVLLDAHKGDDYKHARVMAADKFGLRVSAKLRSQVAEERRIGLIKDVENSQAETARREARLKEFEESIAENTISKEEK